MNTTDLAAWLLAIIVHWSPPSAPVKQVPLEDLAQDIASVVIVKGPIWDGVEGEKKTAMLLATLAYWEGARFATYVDDGSCNRWMQSANAAGHIGPTGRLLPNFAVLSADARALIAHGDCDGGHAHSLWQVWPRESDDQLRSEDLSSRSYAAAAALYLAKKSYEVRGNLSSYSGEPSDVHPKADEREAFARRYWLR